MIKIGIIGAGGYAGVNLLGILLRHLKVQVKWLMSEPAHKGKKISELYPHLNGICDLSCFVLDDLDQKLPEIDLVFLALPHGISINYVPQIIKAGKKAIDLGDDYRFSEEATYGLPEVYKNDIKKARLIGNPGCYPTASTLGLAPLLKNKLIDLTSIVVDAKSGFSGAGRGVSLKGHYCEREGGITAYAVTSHRHMGEIEYQTIRISGDQSAKVTFVPHLMPMTRGILATIYGKLKDQNSKLKNDELLILYKKFYKDQPFVRVVDYEPCTKYVVNSNYCDISVAVNEESGMVIVMSAIDNLIKGAAGQAVQNMNLICGFDETEGLTGLAVYP